jgi:hypothetical protein
MEWFEHNQSSVEQASMSSYLDNMFNRRNGLRMAYRKQLKLMKIGKTTQSCPVCQHKYCKGNARISQTIS